MVRLLLSIALILHVGNVAGLSIQNLVGDDLSPSIREEDLVFSVRVVS